MHSFSVYKRTKDRRKRDTKWIVAWTDESGRRRAKTGFTDYQASVELGRKLAKQAAMAMVGQADPYEEHLRTDIRKHLKQFIEGLRAANRAPRYVHQVEHRIKVVLDGLKIKFLSELDPVAVGRFLTERAQKHKYSGITRNEYISSIKAFTKWAVTYRRMKDDPLAGLKVTERRAIEPAHPRRALTSAEIACLLNAAERRPLLELKTIRTGTNKGKPLAEVTPKAEAQAIHKGRERRLVYLLAIWTGLRRGEIRQLAWGDLELDSMPARIRLRAHTTKSKRADLLPIHPQLADALRAWRPANAGPLDFVVSTVPNMKCLRADLKLAGIDDIDEAKRYVDFHSLRLSLSTMLATHKVSPRVAQALMRHSDPRLTANTYTDEKLLPLAAELQNVPAIESGEDRREVDSTRNLQAVVASLSDQQRQSLLQMLTRSEAG